MSLTHLLKSWPQYGKQVSISITSYLHFKCCCEHGVIIDFLQAEWIPSENWRPCVTAVDRICWQARSTTELKTCKLEQEKKCSVFFLPLSLAASFSVLHLFTDTKHFIYYQESPYSFESGWLTIMNKSVTTHFDMMEYK